MRRALAGYVVLTLGVAGAVAQERIHSNQNRHTLAVSTRTVLLSGCRRNNETRNLLRTLILRGIPQVQQYVNDGTLTPAQGKRAIAETRQDARDVHNIDCVKLYGKLK